MPKLTSKPRKLPFEVIRLCQQCQDKHHGQAGALLPVEGTAEIMRARKYTVGNIVFAILSKPRNPKFHRLVHRFGELCQQNIEAFQYLDAHKVLKRLQWEGHIGCEELGVVVPGVGPHVIRLPKSLAFESMDEGEFQTVFKMFCEYVSSNYWPGLTPEQIAEMAELMEG